MKILILEDDENRIAKFRQWFVGCELDITKDPTEANKWLAVRQYKYIFLDHDLADWHYDDLNGQHENTGLVTAEYLGANAKCNRDAQVYIHSLNPSGSARMSRALKDRPHSLIPFYNLFK